MDCYISIVAGLQNPLTRPILLFLSFILPSMNRFNRSQHSFSIVLRDESLGSYLCWQLSETWSYSICFKQSWSPVPRYNGAIIWWGYGYWGQDLGIHCGWRQHQTIVFSCPQLLHGHSSEDAHFSDTILKDLGIINPLQTNSYSFDTVACLAKHFEQLGIVGSESIDSLREEFSDFTLSPVDLPKVSYFKSATEERPQAGKYCWQDEDSGWRAEISLSLKAYGWTVNNNADSEHGFSINTYWSTSEFEAIHNCLPNEHEVQQWGLLLWYSFLPWASHTMQESHCSSKNWLKTCE